MVRNLPPSQRVATSHIGRPSLAERQSSAAGPARLTEYAEEPACRPGQLQRTVRQRPLPPSVSFLFPLVNRNVQTRFGRGFQLLRTFSVKSQSQRVTCQLIDPRLHNEFPFFVLEYLVDPLW